MKLNNKIIVLISVLLVVLVFITFFFFEENYTLKKKYVVHLNEAFEIKIRRDGDGPIMRYIPYKVDSCSNVKLIDSKLRSEDFSKVKRWWGNYTGIAGWSIDDYGTYYLKATKLGKCYLVFKEQDTISITLKDNEFKDSILYGGSMIVADTFKVLVDVVE